MDKFTEQIENEQGILIPLRKADKGTWCRADDNRLLVSLVLNRNEVNAIDSATQQAVAERIRTYACAFARRNGYDRPNGILLNYTGEEECVFAHKDAQYRRKSDDSLVSAAYAKSRWGFRVYRVPSNTVLKLDCRKIRVFLGRNPER